MPALHPGRRVEFAVDDRRSAGGDRLGQRRTQLGRCGDVISLAAERLCEQLVARPRVEHGRRRIVPGWRFVAAVDTAVVEDDDGHRQPEKPNALSPSIATTGFLHEKPCGAELVEVLVVTPLQIHHRPIA
jgi:hypothetical protein